MNISFTTKEESKRMEEERFLALSVCEEITNPFPRVFFPFFALKFSKVAEDTLENFALIKKKISTPNTYCLFIYKP
jgi:hypothetical protein